MLVSVAFTYYDAKGKLSSQSKGADVTTHCRVRITINPINTVVPAYTTTQLKSYLI
jgi:hypothetical protein